jgi:hypothetical protein
VSVTDELDAPACSCVNTCVLTNAAAEPDINTPVARVLQRSETSLLLPVELVGSDVLLIVRMR